MLVRGKGLCFGGFGVSRLGTLVSGIAPQSFAVVSFILDILCG